MREPIQMSGFKDRDVWQGPPRFLLNWLRDPSWPTDQALEPPVATSYFVSGLTWRISARLARREIPTAATITTQFAHPGLASRELKVQPSSLEVKMLACSGISPRERSWLKTRNSMS